MDLKVTQIFYYNKGVRYFIEDREISKDCFIHIMDEFIWTKRIRDYKSELVKEKVNEIRKENAENVNKLKKAKNILFQKGIEYLFNETQIERLLEKGLLNV